MRSVTDSRTIPSLSAPWKESINHIKYDNKDSDDDDNKDLVNIIDIMADVDEYEDVSGDGDDTLML